MRNNVEKIRKISKHVETNLNILGMPRKARKYSYPKLNEETIISEKSIVEDDLVKPSRTFTRLMIILKIMET
jgi:hypothetical protein